MDKKKLQEIQKHLPDHVTLIAVSKTHTKEEIDEAYACGCRVFGENKVQELKEKYDKIAPAFSFFFIDQNFRIKHQSLHKIVLGNFIHSLQHTGSIPARWTESIDSVFSVL